MGLSPTSECTLPGAPKTKTASAIESSGCLTYPIFATKEAY